jgi:MBG domain (YGX type)/YDG domain
MALSVINAANNSVIDVLVTVNRPANTLTGDLMLAIVTSDAPAGTLIPPSGWTDLSGSPFDDNGPHVQRTWILYRVMQAGDPASFNFEVDAASVLTCGIITFRGQSTSTPISDITSTLNSGSTASRVAPSTTAGQDGSIWMALFGAEANGVDFSLSIPSTFDVNTKIAGNIRDELGTNNAVAIGGFFKAVNAGATGTATSSTGSATRGIQVSLIVNPGTISTTATLTADDKTYDATTTATGSLSLSNIVGGDDVSASASSTTFANANVGTGKTVTASGITLSGADAAKYTLSSSTATDTADISARAITITADDKSKNEGDADPALTYQVTSGAFQGSDAPSGALTRDAGESAGAYAITQGTLDAGSNYALTFIEGTLTIHAVGGGGFPPGILDAKTGILRYKVKLDLPASGLRWSRWKRRGRTLFGLD